MLRQRLITALWGIPLLIAAVWFDSPLPWFTVLAAVWGVLAVWEFYRMVGITRLAPLAVFGMVGTLLFILRPHLDYAPATAILLTAVVALSLPLLLLSPQKEGRLALWAGTVAGVLYVGWLLSYLVALRLEPGTAAFPEAGRNFTFLAIFATFGSDTMAYFIGKAIGRHKLAPRVSPGKTWEGAAAGVAGAIAVTLLFKLPTPLQLPINYWQAILLGLLISVFGQGGDLVESRLKRSAGIKESGRFMPGHGGLLDRMDSLVFAGVVIYFYYVFTAV